MAYAADLIVAAVGTHSVAAAAAESLEKSETCLRGCGRRVHALGLYFIHPDASYGLVV